MRWISIVYFSLIFHVAVSQENSKGTIKVVKQSCYDVDLSIGGGNKDTLSFIRMQIAGGLIPVVKNCNTNASYKIISYEISVNEGLVHKRTGPGYPFANIPHALLTKIRVTNCVVECALEGEKVRSVLIPAKEFSVISYE